MARFAVAFLALSALVGASVASPIEKRSSRVRYLVQHGLGACGWTNKDSDHVIALASDIYDNGAHCGKMRSSENYITNDKTGATAVGTVADECPDAMAGTWVRTALLTPKSLRIEGYL
ncbi:hypothetical protein BC629DRAFT_1439597 [Irpex lacteus]|nr:hypothetical protein BC629DRAFT_1439597 [Irpex lacteus]